MQSISKAGVAGALLLCAVIGSRATAAPRTYEFTLNPAASTTAATIDVAAKTDGTLVGNYDPTANPAGTRTKPGLFGSFGEAENVPVPVSIDPNIAGPINSSAAGTFLLTIDPAAQTATLADLSANLLNAGPVALPVDAAVGLANFRTRNPTSTYIAANVNLPLGNATVKSLRATQTPDPAIGTLTPTANANEYTLDLTAMVTLEAEVEFQGNNISAPSNPIAFPIAGTIKLTGDTATFTATTTLNLDQMDAPDQPIPPFEFSLPTILPPGGTANVILDLMLNETTTQVTGTSTLNATGVSVPEPTAGLLLAAAGLLLPWRKTKPRQQLAGALMTRFHLTPKPDSSTSTCSPPPGGPWGNTGSRSRASRPDSSSSAHRKSAACSS
jgi:hypothetical protein